MILRGAPDVFGQDINQEIGSPQDYTKNLESGTFPESYDLKLPGAGANRSQAQEVVMEDGANAASPVRRNPEEVKDTVMQSATSVKQSRPASEYMPIKLLNQFSNDWTIKARVVKKTAVKSWKNNRGSG